ncbi:MAG: ubiquinone biosynthesis accessory factor UbiJ [Gammaproteobacteria bacterium]
MLIDAIRKPLQQILNRGLGMSASAARLCRDLEGKTFTIEIAGTQESIVLTVASGHLLISDTGGEPDAGVRGGPVSLLRLLGQEPQQAIRDGGIELTGNTEIAAQFQELLQKVRPEPEEELSRVVGDIAAHQLIRTMREIGDWAQRARHSIARSAAEYLQEESQDVPSPTEVDEFCAQVDEVANDMARVQARLNALRAKRNQD